MCTPFFFVFFSCRSVEEYTNYLGLGAGINGIRSAFMASASLRQFEQSIYGSQSSLLIYETVNSFYQMMISPYEQWNASSLFTKYVAQLPVIYDQQKYQDFIDTFGTHYIVQAHYGWKVDCDCSFLFSNPFQRLQKQRLEC